MSIAVEREGMKIIGCSNSLLSGTVALRQWIRTLFWASFMNPYQLKTRIKYLPPFFIYTFFTPFGTIPFMRKSLII